MAVDHAALLDRERDVARREERQKLARDLHDSVVQQVFSMMMQARSLGVLVERGLAPAPEKVAQVADDLSRSAEDVLADLRGMVVELRPATGTERGLVSALHSLVDTTRARTELDRGPGGGRPRRGAGRARRRPARGRLPHRRGGAAQQRQARGGDAGWSSTCRSPPTAAAGASLAEVTDDGRGLGGAADPGSGPASSGLGMTVMQERAARWGGVVRVRDLPAGGARMQLTLPLLSTLPATAAAGTGRRTGDRRGTDPGPGGRRPRGGPPRRGRLPRGARGPRGRRRGRRRARGAGLPGARGRARRAARRRPDGPADAGHGRRDRDRGGRPRGSRACGW